MPRSVAFYRDHLGFVVEATYDDPPYATLVRDGVRLSLAEQGHACAGPTRGDPGGARRPPRQQSVVLVLEVADAHAAHAALAAEGVPFLAEPYAPPWGGLRFFVVDPDGYLVEVEQPDEGRRARWTGRPAPSIEVPDPVIGAPATPSCASPRPRSAAPTCSRSTATCPASRTAPILGHEFVGVVESVGLGGQRP